MSLTKEEIMKLAEFDVEQAKKYGRDLFGGARDTIGESYVLQAMRNQYDKDKLFIEALAESNEKLVEALKIFDAIHFTDSGQSCAFGSDIAYNALADHAERMKRIKGEE